MPARRVLLLTAVEREMLPLLERLKELGPSPPLRWLVAVTGAGKASAASAAARVLREWRPDLLVQVGCAGAFRGSGLSVGDVVVSDLEILGDEGVEAPEGFLDLRRLRLPVASVRGSPLFNEIPVHRLPAGVWRELVARAGGKFKLLRGRTVTVSTCSGTARRAREISRRWRPLAESMEGAAAALAAVAEGRRLLEIRGISNLAGDRNLAAWDIDRASRHAAEVACQILELEAKHGNVRAR